MDRDTFWENMRDLLRLIVKIVIVILILQLGSAAIGHKLEIPVITPTLDYIYQYLRFFWFRGT